MQLHVTTDCRELQVLEIGIFLVFRCWKILERKVAKEVERFN